MSVTSYRAAPPRNSKNIYCQQAAYWSIVRLAYSLYSISPVNTKIIALKASQHCFVVSRIGLIACEGSPVATGSFSQGETPFRNAYQSCQTYPVFISLLLLTISLLTPGGNTTRFTAALTTNKYLLSKGQKKSSVVLVGPVRFELTISTLMRRVF